MTWFDYILLGWWLLGCLLIIAAIGKPKKPTTPDVAVAYVVITVLQVIGLLWSRGVL